MCAVVEEFVRTSVCCVRCTTWARAKDEMEQKFASHIVILPMSYWRSINDHNTCLWCSFFVLPFAAFLFALGPMGRAGNMKRINK